MNGPDVQGKESASDIEGAYLSKGAEAARDLLRKEFTDLKDPAAIKAMVSQLTKDTSSSHILHAISLEEIEPKADGTSLAGNYKDCIPVLASREKLNGLAESAATTGDEAFKKLMAQNILDQYDELMGPATPYNPKFGHDSRAPGGCNPDGIVQHDVNPLKDKYESLRLGLSLRKEQHDTLLTEMDKLEEPLKSQLKNYVVDFENRADKDGLSPKEVADTYKQAERLLEAKDDQLLPEEQRQRLAAEVILHAAHPNEIDQGYYNTCNVTCLEKLIYSKHPSDAAKLVADVALTGQYRAKDGTVVNLEPTPHNDSKKYPPALGTRDHASEIFQVTAVNIHYQQTNSRIRYEQMELPQPANPTGERLMDYSNHTPVPMKANRKQLQEPNLTDEQICQIGDAIIGERQRAELLATRQGLSGDPNDDHISVIDSETALHQKLAEAKAQGKFPLIVQVYCDNEPFYTENHGETHENGGSHVVTISDYYPGPPALVMMDNQWGPQSRHEVGVHELYRAMMPLNQSEKLLKQDVEQERSQHQTDYVGEFELLRLKKYNGDITDSNYEQQTSALIEQMSEHIYCSEVDSSEQAKEVEKLNDTILKLPPDAAMRLLREVEKKHLIMDEAFTYEVAVVSWQALHAENHAAEETDPAKRAQIHKNYDLAKEQLEKEIIDLPESETTTILRQLEQLSQNTPLEEH